jgi:hypothetical protein
MAAAALALGCQPTVTVEHKVDPIYITLDINLKVDRELDEFFDFEEEIEDEALDPGEEIDEVDVEIEVDEAGVEDDDGGDAS